MGRQEDRQEDRHMDRQMDRQMERQMDRQMNSQMYSKGSTPAKRPGPSKPGHTTGDPWVQETSESDTQCCRTADPQTQPGSRVEGRGESSYQ